jgi:ABC-type Fe3+-hydroxamate transport system substrate-binding protein
MPTEKNIISRREFLKNAGLAFGGISIISLLGACSSKVETLTKTDTITKFATVTDTLTTTVTVQPSTVNITDFVGNVVTVPADPQHIGALYGGAFLKFFSRWSRSGGAQIFEG